MPALLLLILRIVVMAIQIAGMMAFFNTVLGWGQFATFLSSLLVALFMPLLGTFLGAYGAWQVWDWSWWLVLLVFLPSLALSLMTLVGVGAAGLLSALFLRKRLQAGFGRGGFGQGGFGHGGFRRPDGASPEQGRQDSGRPADASQGSTIEGEVLSSRVDSDPSERRD